MFLRRRAVSRERFAVEDDVKEAGRQRVQVVGRRRRPACFVGRRTVECSARRGDRFADPADEVVVGEDQVAPGHDKVGRAHVAVDETVAVQHIEGFAHRPQPGESQRLRGTLAQVFGEQRQDPRVTAQRRAVDPGHEGGELVLAPRRRDFEDAGDGLVLQMRPRQPVGAHGAVPGLLVMTHLGDIGPFVFPSTVELHDLERGAHAARSEALDYAVFAAPERHDLIFGPEPRRRRRWRRRRLAQQGREARVERGRFAALRRLVRHARSQHVQGLAVGLVVSAFEQDAQAGAQRVAVRAGVCGVQPLRAHFRRRGRRPFSGRGAGRGHALFGRELGQLEAGEDGRIVVPDENRLRRQVAVQDRRVVQGLAMHLAQRAQCRPGEGQPCRGIPRRIPRALFDGGCQRVGDREEVHFARVAGRRLPGIEYAGRPGMPLQAAQRLELPSRSGLGVRLVARGQVVEMQDHVVGPRGVDTLVYAVKPFLRRRATLQVDIAGEPTQGTVEGDGALRCQKKAEPPDLLRAQCRRRVEIERLAPLLQRAEPHSADHSAGQLPSVRRFARQQHDAVHVTEVRYRPAATRPDLARLDRDSIRLLDHEVGVSVDPPSRPVLDFDDAHADRTDGDQVDLVRLELVRDRPGEVGQQQPLVVAGPQRRLDAALEMLERRAFALVGEWPAVERRHVHVAVPKNDAAQHTLTSRVGARGEPAVGLVAARSSGSGLHRSADGGPSRRVPAVPVGSGRLLRCRRWSWPRRGGSTSRSRRRPGGRARVR